MHDTITTSLRAYVVVGVYLLFYFFFYIYIYVCCIYKCKNKIIYQGLGSLRSLEIYTRLLVSSIAEIEGFFFFLVEYNNYVHHLLRYHSKRACNCPSISSTLTYFLRSTVLFFFFILSHLIMCNIVFMRIRF